MLGLMSLLTVLILVGKARAKGRWRKFHGLMTVLPSGEVEIFMFAPFFTILDRMFFFNDFYHILL